MTLTSIRAICGAKTGNQVALISCHSASRLTGTALALILSVLPYPLAADGWTVTGSMITSRASHTATLLPNGLVLVVGGSADGYKTALATSELYDPSKGTWVPTGSLSMARMLHTATMMSNGKVLVVGGVASLSNNPIFATNCEVYDPGTGIWTSTGSPIKVRVSHTATLLVDGKVLVAGGLNSSELHSSTEVYDPTTAQWQMAGSLRFPRSGHVAALLPNAKVLVAGGAKGNVNLPESSAELYDPATGTWSTTGSPLFNHLNANATSLSDGRALIVGGLDGNGYNAAAELYDPSSGIWSATGSPGAVRAYPGVSPLSNHKVLVAGGIALAGNVAAATNSAELFNPTTSTWSSAGSFATARFQPTATLLLSGKVLVAGGDSGSGALSSAELYEPSSLPVTALFPHLAIGGGFSTAFTFVNTGDTPLNGALIFIGQDGAPLDVALAAPAQISDSRGASNTIQASTSPLTIPPGGAKTVLATTLNATDSTKVGWARVESSGGKLAGVANFQLVSHGKLTTTAGVLSADPVECATFPVSDDLSSNVYTGYAIANPSSMDTIIIKVVTVKEDGTLAATLASITLGPAQQAARFLIEDPAASKTFKGTAVLIGRDGKKFSVVGLVQNDGLYSVIPVTAGKASHIN